jgi:hypothetical protein
MKLFATIFLAIFVFHFVASAQSSKSDTTLISLDSLEMSSPESGIADPPADDLIRVIPPSPNSAAIEQYTSQPVSLYTGIPEISVPIYEIKQGSLSVPIRLNYHAGGIKVNQVASWVGLGWSLDAGGVISRTIYGLPDETFSPALSDVPSSFIDSSTGQPLNINSTNETDFAAWYRASLGELDMEYDRFTVSAPGLRVMLPIFRTKKRKNKVDFLS